VGFTVSCVVQPPIPRHNNNTKVIPRIFFHRPFHLPFSKFSEDEVAKVTAGELYNINYKDIAKKSVLKTVNDMFLDTVMENGSREKA